jgi:lincosamide nucleotidyltransferase A/C/D/E
MTRIAGLAREPRTDMTAADLVELVDYLEGRGVDLWLDGGWGVDALLGEQRRAHDDLDVVVPLDQVPRLQEALGERGYLLVGGSPPASFEMTDDEGRQVDVHPVVFDERGDGVYQLREGGTWPYPAEGFAGVGSVLGRRVRCLTPEVQMLCHTGYPPHRTSFDDVTALGRRFGIPIPDAYRRSRELYPIRTAQGQSASR